MKIIFNALIATFRSIVYTTIFFSLLGIAFLIKTAYEFGHRKSNTQIENLESQKDSLEAENTKIKQILEENQEDSKKLNSENSELMYRVNQQANQMKILKNTVVGLETNLTNALNQKTHLTSQLKTTTVQLDSVSYSNQKLYRSISFKNQALLQKDNVIVNLNNDVKAIKKTGAILIGSLYLAFIFSSSLLVYFFIRYKQLKYKEQYTNAQKKLILRPKNIIHQVQYN